MGPCIQAVKDSDKQAELRAELKELERTVAREKQAAQQKRQEDELKVRPFGTPPKRYLLRAACMGIAAILLLHHLD